MRNKIETCEEQILTPEENATVKSAMLRVENAVRRACAKEQIVDTVFIDNRKGEWWAAIRVGVDQRSVTTPRFRTPEELVAYIRENHRPPTNDELAAKKRAQIATLRDELAALGVAEEGEEA